MKSINELYKFVKIDWTDFLISSDDCQNNSQIEFELMPIDYLEFAKNNIVKNNAQSCIEGLSNAKRAIECQVDLLISSIGFNYQIFDSKKNYPEVKKFINQFYKEEQYKGLTDKLKLLNILDLAPTMIISNIRKMRNLIEHEYKLPRFEDVKSAVEIADLFINSSNNKFGFSPTIIDIGKKPNKNNLKDYYICIPYIKLFFSNNRSIDTVEIYLMNNYNSINFDGNFHIDLKPNDKYYIEVIYCILTRDYNILPYIFGCDINPSYISYKPGYVRDNELPVVKSEKPSVLESLKTS